MTSRFDRGPDVLRILLLLATGACIGFALAVVVNGIGSARAGEPEIVPVPPGALTIVDGDTVKIGRQRLRLLSIDAPEISHPRCAAEKKAGLAAKARIAELLADRIVAIRFSGQIDPYERPLVHLIAPAGDIGSILMAEGYALPYVGGRVARDARAAHWCGAHE